MQLSLSQIRKIYFVGALWNYAAVLVLLALMIFYPQGLLYFVSSIPGGSNMIWVLIACAAIFLFGVGYMMASFDPILNRNIILLGIAGKVIVVGIFGWSYWQGQAGMGFLGTGAVDLVFALLFSLAFHSTVQRHSRVHHPGAASRDHLAVGKPEPI